jgi:hypothetical protein
MHFTRDLAFFFNSDGWCDLEICILDFLSMPIALGLDL